MLKRTLTTIAFLLFATLLAPAGFAQGHQPLEGLWYLNVTIAGAPPCQCIQISTFNADGTIEGPANDHFSGDIRGVWARGDNGTFVGTLVQNNINPDGSAGGMYIIKMTATLVSNDSGSGTSTFQIVDNSGAVVASGTATFKMTRVKAR